MGIFDFLKLSDINSGVEQYRALDEALLVDVRTKQEFSQGHIPGSINVPLDSLKDLEKATDNKGLPLFVYCLSGARSNRAVALLSEMGYENVKNIGGINHYRGGLSI